MGERDRKIRSRGFIRGATSLEKVEERLKG